MPKRLPTEQRVIRAALRVKGDSLTLADALKVPSTALLAWVAGEADVPAGAFEQALRIVLDSLEPASPSAVPPPRRAVERPRASRR